MIPQTLCPDMKKKIHAGYAGINFCLIRARTLVFWPRMSSEIRQYCEACTTCVSVQMSQPQEPLKLHSLPKLPWQKIGTDLFNINKSNYLITVDYFSQYFEIDLLPNTHSDTIIECLKANCVRHGIPDIIMSNNGPQILP